MTAITRKKTYIQCPRCETFVDEDTFNIGKSSYRCDFCGLFTVKEQKAANTRLKCCEEKTEVLR